MINKDDFKRLAERCRNTRPSETANIITIDTWLRLTDHLAKQFDEFNEPALSAERFKSLSGYKEVNERLAQF